MRFVALLVIASCTTGESSSTPVRPAPLPALPPAAAVETMRFRDAGACAQCHLVPDSASALHDATGANVSPVLLWRSSLMANAARDPYYLAVFAEERARAPARAAAIDATCTRCHGPAGSEELADSGGTLGFTEMTTSMSASAELARDGVTCTLCHQIAPDKLGEDGSFTGRFTVGYRRTVYGLYADPTTSPMQLIVNFTPTQGTHVASSELCGTCHTVIVQANAATIVEQATFLEWRASSFPAAGKTCESCHVATIDSAGQPIRTVVAGFPSGLSARTPVGRHDFVGGNSYVLSLLADAGDWSGSRASAAELVASAARDDAHLQTAAKLQIAGVTRDADGTLVVTVHVENQTGHKLPTGYPTRRMWLHVTAGAFESGRADAIAAQPHRDVIDSADQAQVWEAVLVDADGKPTHRTLDAVGYGKDDRILPAGFSASSADATRARAVGTDGDASFVAGSDDVTYRISSAASGTAIAVELLYQVTSPEIVDAIDASATPAGTRFVDLARARPVVPVVLARTSATAP